MASWYYCMTSEQGLAMQRDTEVWREHTHHSCSTWELHGMRLPAVCLQCLACNETPGDQHPLPTWSQGEGAHDTLTPTEVDGALTRGISHTKQKVPIMGCSLITNTGELGIYVRTPGVCVYTPVGYGIMVLLNVGVQC